MNEKSPVETGDEVCHCLRTESRMAFVVAVLGVTPCTAGSSVEERYEFFRLGRTDQLTLQYGLVHVKFVCKATHKDRCTVKCEQSGICEDIACFVLDFVRQIRVSYDGLFG